ncbi:MAG: tetratricopeptide repeat protein [Bdellovibrionota bacterium]
MKRNAGVFLLAGVLLLAGAGLAKAGPQAELEIAIVKANVLLNAGKAGEALEAAEKVLGTDPQSTGALDVKGRALLELGRTEEALKAFQQIESQSPREQSWRVGYGLVLLKLNRNGEAADQFEKAADDNPSNGAAQYNLGFALYSAGKYRDAISPLSEAIKLEENLQAAYYYRGRCHYLLGEAEQSKPDFERSLQANASGPLADLSRKALSYLQDVKAAPEREEEAKAYQLRGRIGFAYDSNHTVTPNDLGSDTIGGNQQDLRLEVELGGLYRGDIGPDTFFNAGYRFAGYFQLGADIGNSEASTDFTLMNHDATLSLGQEIDGENVVSLTGDYILTTLGRLSDIPASSSFNAGHFGHGIYSQQVIATARWSNAVSEDLSAGAMVQYAHEFYLDPSDNIVIRSASGFTPLTNDTRDAHAVQLGPEFMMAMEDKSVLDGSLTFFWRSNESEGARSRYMGPRLRLGYERPLPEVTDELTFLGDAFYAFENHYDDEFTTGNNRKDHRLIFNLKFKYDLKGMASGLATQLGYRAELLRSNLSPDTVSYDRHVVVLSLLFEQ